VTEQQIAWTIFIVFHIVTALLEYGIGRVACRFVEKTWIRDESHIFYWFIGMIVFNLIAWPTYGIIKLVQWIL
jgi:hypothetical protein